jgi:hypothetical protein
MLVAVSHTCVRLSQTRIQIRTQPWDGGDFFLDESSFGLKLSLYPEFQLPMCPGTGLTVCGDGGGGGGT